MNRVGAIALRSLPQWLTTPACAAVLVGIIMLARQAALLAPVTPRPLLIVGAATFDLAITLPLVCWWMLARQYRWSPLVLLPLYFVALAVAGRVLPENERQALLFFHVLAAPLEVLSVWLFVKRARSPGRLGEVLRYEISVLRWALWRAPAADTARSFTYHRNTAYGAIVFALLMATSVEVPALHLLTSLWSPKLAWLLTAVGLYGCLWLIGDWRALRAMPATIEGGTLRLRFGLRWRVDVPVAEIVAIRPPTPVEHTSKGAVDLKLSLPGSRWVVLELDRPVVAEGIYGLRREARTIGLGVDEPTLLKEALETARKPPTAPAPPQPLNPENR